MPLLSLATVAHQTIPTHPSSVIVLTVCYCLYLAMLHGYRQCLRFNDISANDLLFNQFTIKYIQFLCVCIYTSIAVKYDRDTQFGM